jgi:hypothetical protein
LLVEIGIFWRSSGRRDVGDMGLGGWSRWSDAAACTWSRRLRGLRKRVAIVVIGLLLFVVAGTGRVVWLRTIGVARNSQDRACWLVEDCRSRSE